LSGDVVEVEGDTALQLIEATHALYRAAVALEGIRPEPGAPPISRCPYLVDGDGKHLEVGSAEMTSEEDAYRTALDGITRAYREVADLPTPEPVDPDPHPGAEVELNVAAPGPIAGDGPAARRTDLLDGLTSHLNKVVIHGIYEAGLALQSALQRTTEPSVAGKIEDAVVILDDTITQTRAVFVSGHPVH
jgi:hypothetical protein